MEERVSSELAPNCGSARRVHIADIVASDTSEPTSSKNETLTRIKIFGTVMDKRVFRSEGKVDYGDILVDDGSGFMIQIKAWSSGIAAVEKVGPGDMIDVVGKVKHRDREVYVIPEIIRKINNPNWETVRELEIIKDHLRRNKSRLTRCAPSSTNSSDLESEILGIIESTESNIGVEYIDLIKRIKHSGEEEIKKVLKELLNRGKIYESRPSRYRK